MCSISSNPPKYPSWWKQPLSYCPHFTDEKTESLILSGKVQAQTQTLVIQPPEEGGSPNAHPSSLPFSPTSVLSSLFFSFFP